jgi:hypothetical protein
VVWTCSVPVADIPPVVTTSVDDVIVCPELLEHVIVVVHCGVDDPVHPDPGSIVPLAPTERSTAGSAAQLASVVANTSW